MTILANQPNLFFAYIYSLSKGHLEGRVMASSVEQQSQRLFTTPCRVPDALLSVLKQNGHETASVKTIWLSIANTGEQPAPMLVVYEIGTSPADHPAISRSLLKGVDQVIHPLQSLDCLHIDYVDRQLQEKLGTSATVVYHRHGT